MQNFFFLDEYERKRAKTCNDTLLNHFTTGRKFYILGNRKSESINYPIPVRKQDSHTQLLTEVRECTGENVKQELV